jgi:hypothetical protein
MLVEFLALSRLVRAVTRQPQRRVTAALAAVLVASAPLTLINPARLYDDLLTPSLVLLWLSQLVVFAVYPRLPHAKVGGRPGASILAVAASGYALFGLYTAVTAATS